MNENELDIINLDPEVSNTPAVTTDDKFVSLLTGFGTGALFGAGLTIGGIILYKKIKAVKAKKAAESEASKNEPKEEPKSES